MDEQYREALVKVGLDPDTKLPNGETMLDALFRCVNLLMRYSTIFPRYGDERYLRLIASEAQSLAHRAKWPGYWEIMKDPAAPSWM